MLELNRTVTLGALDENNNVIDVPQFLLSTDKEDIKDFRYLTNRLEKNILILNYREEKFLNAAKLVRGVYMAGKDGWLKKYGSPSPVHDNIEDTHKSR
ncbi:hypothetical protein Glove_64g15 [Diversispora epigaea]|uniref:Uncharacterized protein n=1 Tax=Diversispora epigaea TaxID=1348612 RepID=A0A397JHZ1_9GLOM|nr:hypothetical protein Glove_64g15 [Diversispora epigaea]